MMSLANAGWIHFCMPAACQAATIAALVTGPVRQTPSKADADGAADGDAGAAWDAGTDGAVVDGDGGASWAADDAAPDADVEATRSPDDVQPAISTIARTAMGVDLMIHLLARQEEPTIRARSGRVRSILSPDSPAVIRASSTILVSLDCGQPRVGRLEPHAMMRPCRSHRPRWQPAGA